jgi:hypothetical protein
MLKICIVSNKTKKCSSMWQCGALNVPQKSVRCLGMFSLQFPQYAHPDGNQMPSSDFSLGTLICLTVTEKENDGG